MRAELEPLLEELNEQDIFGSDDDPKNLNRILFVQKMGIYVEVRLHGFVELYEEVVVGPGQTLNFRRDELNCKFRSTEVN